MEKPKAGRPKKYRGAVRVLVIYAPDAARAEIRAAAELIKAKYLIDAEHPPDHLYLNDRIFPHPDWIARYASHQPPTKKDDGDN